MSSLIDFMIVTPGGIADAEAKESSASLDGSELKLGGAKGGGLRACGLLCRC